MHSFTLAKRSHFQMLCLIIMVNTSVMLLRKGTQQVRVGFLMSSVRKFSVKGYYLHKQVTFVLCMIQIFRGGKGWWMGRGVAVMDA